MELEQQIKTTLIDAFKSLYDTELPLEQIKLESTRKDFKGDYTFVVFPFLRFSKLAPEATAEQIGKFLQEQQPMVAGYNVIKGFLNLEIDDQYWRTFVKDQAGEETFGLKPAGSGRTIMVEYSSPNTNKPLHLGHIRNNLLGYSVAQILEANGHKVIKANLINDRGIHICKSMLAWLRFGEGETPQSSGMKGDHLVGKYYVVFDQEYKKEVEALMADGMDKDTAEKQAPLMLEAQEMLRKWEANDAEVRKVWETMNGWVYEGFKKTYSDLGVAFDQYYYESNTYLLGKELAMEGLKQDTFFSKDDGSVWANLEKEGLDEKLLLRADGTSVYITQDLGTAQMKYDQYQYDTSVYVVGNEQDYHFKVLKMLLHQLGKPFAEGIHHLSYGMVDLPSGKMKSREGTVVDADDLIAEMKATAQKITEEQGKTEGLDETTLNSLYEAVGMGALKFYLLKVDPVKRMLFNPAESIDFHGHTGPFIQYTHARICSVLRKAEALPDTETTTQGALSDEERQLARWLHQFPEAVAEAGRSMSPAAVANYVYELAKLYNQFYQSSPILKEEDPGQRQFRLTLSELCRDTIKRSLALLGIEAPDRM